jgi:hypothetical protein
MGGLFVATILTLIVLPALYVAWFRVKEPEGERAAASAQSDCGTSGGRCGSIFELSGFKKETVKTDSCEAILSGFRISSGKKLR